METNEAKQEPHAAAPGGVRDTEHGPLIDHEVDGISEYDNPMPPWMTAIFIGTIVFSAWYGYHYHFGKGESFAQEYASAHKKYEEKRFAREKAEAANVTEQSLAVAVTKNELLSRGAALFKEKCVACHAANGEGLVGPNLTDEFQINGSTRMDIFGIVAGGKTGTAMVAWRDQLSAEDLLAASAYAISLRGKKLPGKPEEGNKAAPFPEVKLEQ